MDYNTSKEKIALPEYGRNFQNMVELIESVENKEERTKMAYILVKVMSNLLPSKHESYFDRKMWDQLHIMSNFKLDVDSPYPAPSLEDVSRKPNKISYRDNLVRYRHYGRIIQSMVAKVAAMEGGEEKQECVHALANQMKKLYLIWNRDVVEDDLIINDLHSISSGDLSFTSEMGLTPTASIFNNREKKRNNNSNNHQKKKKKNKKQKK